MIATIFGSLALRGASAAFAAPPAGGFVHDPASLTARGGTMFSEPPLEPGQSVTRHATVASTGPAAPVHLFGEVSGTGLARFLTIRVTRDTGPTDALAPARGGQRRRSSFAAG